MKLTTRLAAVLLVATTAPVVGVGAAQAQSGNNDVVRQGTCSGSTHWKIKAKPDDGRIETESEIDSNRNGQTWTWVLRRNGNVAARGSSTTKAPSGSFSVSRRTPDGAGSDAFKFRAVNQANGEVCVARVTL